MAQSKRGYLEPKVADPSMTRKENNGQAVNPPSYMQYGGFGQASDLNRGKDNIMNMEKGGPQAQRNKPI